MTAAHQHDDRADLSAQPTPSQTDAASGSLKVLYLSLAQKAIVDEVLAIESGLERARTLLAEQGGGRKLRALAQEFVQAHGFYAEKLGQEVRRCTDKSSSHETRWLGWSLGGLLADRSDDPQKAARRIAGELQIQAKDPTSDRFFDTRHAAGEAFIAAADKEAARRAPKPAKPEQPTESPNTRGAFGGLLAFVRV